MDKYRILNRDLYTNFIKENYADEEIISNKLKKTSPKNLLKTLLENNENTDLQVIIDDWTFNCHLSALQCYSTYFRRDRFRAERQAELPIDQVSPTTFTRIYEWMITDEPKVQREGIVELFISAFYLGIERLTEQIWGVLSNGEYINENEAYLLYHEAASAHVECIKELMLKRVSKFFLILVAFKEFVLMPVDDLCCLMSSDAIGVNTEIEVFMACLRWLAYKWTERKKYLLKVLGTVRFGLLPPGFLIELDRDMIDLPLIQRVMRKPKIKQLVIDGLKLATKQFCYGSNSNIKQRQWLYDEKCEYHLKVNQLIEYKITYEKFHDYLYYLQNCNKDHWRAFVYIKTEKTVIGKNLDLSHLKLLQESKTCIIKAAAKTDDSSRPSMEKSITICKDYQIVKHQKESHAIDDCKKLEMLLVNKAFGDLNRESSSTESSTFESFSLKTKTIKQKRYRKKKLGRKNQAKAEKKKDIGILTSDADNDADEECKKKLCFSKPISEQPMKAESNKQENNHTAEPKENLTIKPGNTFLKQLSVLIPAKFLASSSDDETYYDVENATTSKATSENIIALKKENICRKQAEEKQKDTIAKEPSTLIMKMTCEEQVKAEAKDTTAKEPSALKLSKYTKFTEPKISDCLPKTVTLREESKNKQKNISFKDESELKIVSPYKSLFKNKTLLILGGTDPFSQTCEQTFIDKVLLYNDEFRRWIKLPHTAFGTRHHHAAVVCQGLVYIIGGTKVLPGSKKVFFETSIWSFNPKTRIWTFTTNLPQNRRDFAALAISSKKNETGFLIIGGETFDRVALNTVWLYKIKEKIWERKASLNIGRYGFAATIVNGRDVWVAGGIAFAPINDTSNADCAKRSKPFTQFITDTMECLSLNGIFEKSFKGKWNKLSYRLPRPCLFGRFCSTTANDIFLIGGFGTADSSRTLDSFDAIFRFDIKNKLWHKCGTLKQARHGHDIVLLDDCIIIIGGVSSQLNGALQSVEVFCTKTNESLKLIPNLPWPNSGLAAVIVRGEY